MLEEIYKGRTLKELQDMNITDLAKILPARHRRLLKRGFTETQKKLLARIEKFLQGRSKKPIRTHSREMIILPLMIGLVIYVYNGKEFTPVPVTIEMLGHRLGEFTLTRKKPAHSAPGIGATKSSTSIQKK